MPLILPGNVASATASTTYDVDNSLMFDGSDSYLNITSGSSPTSTQKFTVSFWLKRSELGREQHIFGGVSAAQCYFISDDRLRFADTTSGTNYYTTQKFRDVSAWYHIVIAVDTTLGTAGDRARIYVNGSEITAFDTETNATQNNNTAYNIGSTAYVIGRYNPSQSQNYYYSGYMAEYVFIDGQQLAPTSFGEFDDDSPTIWKPIDVSGLTFGTNGYYLDFEDSGDLGDDESGNTNDFTENSIAATDQSTDTPTNSFCTINPLDVPYGSVTLTEGNLVQVQTGGGSAYPYNRATMGVAKGKWYFEGKAVAISGDSVIGIASVAASSATNALYRPENNYAYYNHASTHGAYSDDALVDSTDYDDYDDDDIISVAFDLDNNKLYFAKNGTWAHSGDPTSGATGTGAVSITAAASTVDGFYFPAAADYGGSPRTTWSMNFGSPAHTVSSGNADGNGYGNFEHAPPSGYYALCTKNLAEFG
jgi:hypothetical protein